ncbi:hypothetical protein C2U70_23925 [Bradyrhizobium guangdongense]|nr:hypothetical protein C2U70_23925 [Bradyrhizobium guangdongense]
MAASTLYPAARLTPAIGLSLFASKARAEPVTIALAVGSFLAHQIAAANSTDGGLSDLAKANHDLLLVALAKLDRIENLLADVYKAVANLPNEIDKILARHETQDLQADLASVINGYRELISNKDPKDSDAQWLSRKSTQTQIQSYYARLLQARQKADVKKLFDPTTALLVGPSAMVENGLLVLSGESAHGIKKTLTDTYLAWLNKMENAEIVGSAAHYVKSAAQRHAELSSVASQTPLGRGFDFPSGSKSSAVGHAFDGETRSALAACAGFNNSRAGSGRYCDDERRPGNRNFALLGGDGKELSNDDYMAVFGTTNPDSKTVLKNAQQILDKGFVLAACTPAVPAVTEPHERLYRRAKLSEVELVDEKMQPLGVKVWSLEALPETRGVAGQADVPHDGSCQIVNEYSDDSGARLNRMRSLDAWAAGDRNYTAFSSLLDQINTERARFAFGLQALIATQAARQSIEKVISSYG